MRTAWVRVMMVVLALLLVLPLRPPPAAAEGDERVVASRLLPAEVAALYFEPTAHNLAGGFLRYWWEHGQVGIFGYPITEELNENGRPVQYFERARFEYFPEHAGTPYEVQLGHLGRALAEMMEAPRAAAGARADAILWSSSLPGEIALRAVQRAALTAVAVPIERPYQAVLIVPSTEIRQAPTAIAPALGVTYARHLVWVVGVAEGEPVGGSAQWYQVAPSGGFVPATTVKPFTAPAPPWAWAGRWVDVNLSEFYITAYEGTTPIYSAIITAGRDSRTPLGIFYVQRRVRSETMDSATVGIPKGHPEYYYLKNVEYVQYFLRGGFALHGNYWVHPSRFGAFSSNGCVGLMNKDAAFFWEFATVGTPIHIHY